MQRSNAGLFWPVLAIVAAVDFSTKSLAAGRLLPQGVPHTVYGDVVRFTLVHNPGAAFGLNLGSYSRWIFMILTIVALVILGRLYAATRAGDVVRSLALALVCGGAIGNLIDRVRQGYVVDFVDFGYHSNWWPVFNVADSAIVVGVALLALNALSPSASEDAAHP